MGLTVQNLAELDVADVQAKQEFLASLMQEAHPELDLKRGAIHDGVLYPSAEFGDASDVNLDRLRRSMSLLEINNDPVFADADVVDQVLSNFEMTRRPGTNAVGSLTIVVSKLATVTVPSGGIFVADGKQFQTELAYVGRTSSASVQSSADRVLVPRGDGTYSFTIDVVAVAVGTSSMLRKDVLAVPDFSIVNLVKAFATSDFTGGVSTETNAELLLRLPEGRAAKTTSNRINMTAMLRAEPSFENFVSTSIIGYGDAEMIRDRHTIFPVSMGGRADWYIRTQELPQSLTMTLTATLIEKTVDGKGNWQLSIGRDLAPGFYDVVSVQPSDNAAYVGTFMVNDDIRSNDLTPILGELLPDISTLVEGAYSHYQAAVVQFKDDLTSTASLIVNESVQDYLVTVRAMPLISDIQSFIANRSHRNYAGDVLVKAPVPCTLSLSFSIYGKAGDKLPDVDAICDDLAQYVNRLGFTGRLAASSLSDIIHNHLTGKATLSAIDMFGRIRRPDGTIKPLRSSEVLIIGNEHDRLVSARTVCFLLDPASIAISTQTVNIPEI